MKARRAILLLLMAWVFLGGIAYALSPRSLTGVRAVDAVLFSGAFVAVAVALWEGLGAFTHVALKAVRFFFGKPESHGKSEDPPVS